MADSVHGHKETDGSGEVRQWCESCKDDGNHVIASGFCTVCEESMCSECWKVHCKPRKMKDHVVVRIREDKKSDKKRIENATESHPLTKSGSAATMCTEECPIHMGKMIEYFCETHEQLCCSACNGTNHKLCGDVIYIPDTVAGLADSGEILQLMKKLKSIEDSVEYNERCVKTNLEAAEAINKDTKQHNATLQKELIELIKNKKARVDSEADQIFENDTKKMKEVGETCNEVAMELARIHSTLQDIKKSGQLCQLFVNMKRAKISACAVEDQVREIEMKNNIHRYVFEPNATLVDLRNTLDSMGKFVPEYSQKSLVSHLKYIDVASEGEKRTSRCYVSGLAIVSEKYIVATDIGNNSARIIDTTENKLVYILPLQSTPRDVCRITEEEVAVTLPGMKKLQFLSVIASGEEKLLKNKREVDVGGQCYGIICNRKELIVSFIPSLFIQSSKIKILDMDGHVLRTLTQKLLGSPGYLALSHDDKTLYVSDWGNSTVTCMTMEGKVIATYFSEDLTMPHGLVCSRSGSVFVCGRQSRNVHQLSSNCEKVQVLLQAENKLVEPFSIAYNDKEHKLYIGIENTICVFSVI